MKKEANISLQASIIKKIVGLAIATLTLTGVAFIDKILLKLVVCISFSMATSIVGTLYVSGFLASKVEGGKARISIFIILTYVLYTVFNGIIQFLFSIPIWVYILILFGIATLIVSMWLLLKHINVKEGQLNLKKELNECPTCLIEKENENKLYTLSELWNKNGKDGEYLKIYTTNPNIEWIKIKKGPYGNGKFYGYFKIKNAKQPLNGEIYYSNKKIWQINDNTSI